MATWIRCAHCAGEIPPEGSDMWRDAGDGDCTDAEGARKEV